MPPFDTPVDFEDDELTIEIEDVLTEQLPIAEQNGMDFLINAFEEERPVFNRVPTELDNGTLELDFRIESTLRLANLLNEVDAVRIRILAAAGVVHARVFIRMADFSGVEDVHNDESSFETKVMTISVRYCLFFNIVMRIIFLLL